MPRCAEEQAYLLAGRFARGGGPVARPATSRGTVSMVVLEPQPQALRNESSQRDGNKVAVRQKKQATLTTPDLVLLSLLAERPMHGYQANLELERREVRDWAAISRPQVYYSLEKLAQQGLLREADASEPAAGPERRVYTTSARGRTALATALHREDWTTGRERP